MSENKTGKYFKYAIGEILLVMVGILLALQVNNWNENRKNTIKETRFLQSFKWDTEANITELKRVIKKSNATAQSLDSILLLKSDSIPDIDVFNFTKLVMTGTGFTVFGTHEGTVSDILGSGNLDIIKNDSIRLAIGSWYSNLKAIREWEKIEKKSVDDYGDYLKLHINIYALDSLSVITPEIKNFLMNDRYFLNSVSDRYLYPLELHFLYKEKLPKLERLLKIIDNEL